MKEKLNKFAKNITSQDGEDGILEYIITHTKAQIRKIVCEFGAWDGKYLSNTYNLWHDQGWKAILIESSSDRYRQLVHNCSGKDVHTLNCHVTPKGEGTLDHLFKINGFDPKIGILSIDIDSYDYHIWKNLSYVDPQIVVVEHNQTIPAYIEYHDPEEDTFLRCSAKSLESLGLQKGYQLVCCTATNSIFVKETLFNADKFPNMPVEYLFDYSHLNFQILLAGMDNMYPVFSRKVSFKGKILFRLIHRILSLVGKKRYIRPSENVIRQIKKYNLDI